MLSTIITFYSTTSHNCSTTTPTGSSEKVYPSRPVGQRHPGSATAVGYIFQMFISRGSLGISDSNFILFTFDNNMAYTYIIDNHAKRTACSLLFSVREIIYGN